MDSDVFDWFLGDYSLLNLLELGLPEPFLNIVHALVIRPAVELFLGQVVHFPAFHSHELCRQLLHLAGHAVEGSGVLDQVEVNRNLECAEAVVELHEVVERQELGRVHETVAVHEHFKVNVLAIFVVVIVDEHDVEVLLSVP